MTQIHTIDLHYLGVPRTIAAFLVVGPSGELVLVEAGPASTLDALLQGIRDLGHTSEAIHHVIVSHIHLDHAGAAGWWAKQGATVYVHEFGAHHLIDPRKLIASAQRIYGDQMDRLWGPITPAPAERVVPVHHRDTIAIGSLRFIALATPGHARHHHAFRLASDGDIVCFAGDAAAMIVPGVGFVALPTPPPEFDLVAWLTSLARLELERFDRIYLTHFGAVSDVRGHLAAVRTALRCHATFVLDRLGMTPERLRQEYAAWVRREAIEAGVARDQLPHFVSENLTSMSAHGMIRYWTKVRGGDGTAPQRPPEPLQSV